MNYYYTDANGVRCWLYLLPGEAEELKEIYDANVDAIEKYNGKPWRGRDYYICNGHAYTVKGLRRVKHDDAMYVGYHPNKRMAELWWEFMLELLLEAGSNEQRTWNDEIDLRDRWFRQVYYGER